MTWFDYIGSVRWGTTLTPLLRELAIVRIAHSARHAYAIQQHVPNIAVPDGVSLEECEALKDWRASGMFSEAERAALAYVDAMLASAEVPDAIFSEVRKHYNERETVELTILVGVYIMHHRIFTALKVDLEPKKA
jgi:alkylhydroperoxidase family enzyme